MKKTITLLLVIFSLLSLKAQDELIKNGDFSQGVSGSALLKDMAYWSMDMATPSGGWWSLHAGLTSTDTTLYQVVETISTDSVLYTLTFDCSDAWISDKIIAIASVTGADSTVRARVAQKEFLFTETFEFVFGFKKDSEHAGKRLVIEFDLTSTTADAAWANLDNVSMKKVIEGVNSAPVAVVGAAQTVKGGTPVSLDGSGSSDFEGSALTYFWTSVYPGIFLSDRTAVSPTFTAPDVTELTTFEFTLIVSDGELSSEFVIAYVTVFPAGELIRNGGFELSVEGSELSSTSLKDISYWNIDEVAANVLGGRWGNAGLKNATLSSKDPVFYQVIKTIGAGEASYSLTFSARSSWNSAAIKSIFSVSDADSSLRTAVDSLESVFEINVPGGVNTTEMKAYSHIFVIPANSAYVGKKLILEFDNIPYEDGNDNGWMQLDNVSLIESSASAVNPDLALDLKLYPNPATDVLYIQHAAKITRADIYSVLGTLEKSCADQDIRQIAVSELSKGLHFITLTTDSGVITRKFQVK